MVRPTNHSPEGRRVIKIGVSLGYWPCLCAPSIRLNAGVHVVEVWYGTQSKYKG